MYWSAPQHPYIYQYFWSSAPSGILAQIEVYFVVPDKWMLLFKIMHFENKLFTSDCETCSCIVMSMLLRLKALGGINWFYHDRKQTIVINEKCNYTAYLKERIRHRTYKTEIRTFVNPRSVFDKQQRSNSATGENEPTRSLHALNRLSNYRRASRQLIVRESVLTLTRIVDMWEIHVRKRGGRKTEQQSYFVHTFSGLLNCFKSLTYTRTRKKGIWQMSFIKRFEIVDGVLGD